MLVAHSIVVGRRHIPVNGKGGGSVGYGNLPTQLSLLMSAVSKDGGRVLLTGCDMSSVHCLTAFLLYFFVSPYVCLCLSR